MVIILEDQVKELPKEFIDNVDKRNSTWSSWSRLTWLLWVTLYLRPRLAKKHMRAWWLRRPRWRLIQREYLT